MFETAEELKKAKLAVIDEINARSPEPLTGLYEKELEELEVLRDTLPERPDPDSDEAKARAAAIEARKTAPIGGLAQDKPKGRATHTVAADGAVCTKRGIVLGGEPINAGDLPGGKEAFAALVKSGQIVKG